MDNYEKLEIKLDTMNDTMHSMLDLNRQTLGEIKKQNDVFGLKLEILEKSIEKIATEVKAHIEADVPFMNILGVTSKNPLNRFCIAGNNAFTEFAR